MDVSKKMLLQPREQIRVIRASSTARRKWTVDIRIGPKIIGRWEHAASGPTYFHQPVRSDANAAQIWVRFASPRTNRCIHARPLPSTQGSCVIDRGRFVSYAGSVACMGKGCDAASISAPPSMASSL
jgi:hypothetical protein